MISFCPGGFLSRTAEKTIGTKLKDPENWMNPQGVALFMKQFLDLPKNMQVTEVIIDRKVSK